MPSSKTLTVKLAEQYKRDAESVSLEDFTEAEDGALRILAALDEDHGEGLLDLSGLPSISAEQLKLLQGTPLALRFDGVTSIDMEMGSALAEFTSSEVGFLSVDEVDDSVLEEVCRYGGPGLHLGLRAVSEHQASLLAACEASLLALPSLESLTEDAAAALVRFEGELKVNLRPFPIEVRRILRKHSSFSGWGEVETFAEPVCKFCGDKGRIFVFSDMTPSGVLKSDDRTAAEGWYWNICPSCIEGMTEEEINESVDSDA